MTREQRRRHLLIWAVVLPFAALVIVLGWFARSDVGSQSGVRVLEVGSAPDGEPSP